jgi:hypothetical protein
MIGDGEHRPGKPRGRIVDVIGDGDGDGDGNVEP